MDIAFLSHFASRSHRYAQPEGTRRRVAGVWSGLFGVRLSNVHSCLTELTCEDVLVVVFFNALSLHILSL